MSVRIHLASGLVLLPGGVGGYLPAKPSALLPRTIRPLSSITKPETKKQATQQFKRRKGVSNVVERDMLDPLAEREKEKEKMKEMLDSDMLSGNFSGAHLPGDTSLLLLAVLPLCVCLPSSLSFRLLDFSRYPLRLA